MKQAVQLSRNWDTEELFSKKYRMASSRLKRFSIDRVGLTIALCCMSIERGTIGGPSYMELSHFDEPKCLALLIFLHYIQFNDFQNITNESDECRH